jgi:Cys-tRNA(Pro)/Cys-tRNA(Cys) deacylase
VNDRQRAEPVGEAEPTAAVRALREAGVAHQTLRYGDPDGGPVSGTEAAERLGLDPRAVLKTLVVEVGDDLVLALVPVPGRVDLDALAALFGVDSVRLARPDLAERATGSALGAVSPFGLAESFACVVDRSAVERSRVYVSGGRHGLELGLAPEVLVEVTGARVAPIVRDLERPPVA